MKQLLSIAAVFAVLAFGAVAFAQNNQQSSKPKSIVDYAKMGTGVYNPKFDDNGELTSVIVVGTSRISTVFGASKGKDIARRKASLVCDAEFAKWCKEELEVTESSDGEDIIVMKGSETDDDETLAEEGKSEEIMKQKISLYAKQTLRGMQVLYSELNADTKEYVIVKGLNMKKVAAVKKVAQTLNDDNIDEPEEAETAPRSYDDDDDAPASPAKNRKGTLKNESHVSPDADEFL